MLNFLLGIYIFGAIISFILARVFVYLGGSTKRPRLQIATLTIFWPIALIIAFVTIHL